MPSADERVVAVIPNVSLTNGARGYKGQRHSLVLTDERVLFVRLTKKKLSELNRLPKPGKKRLAQIGAKNDVLGLLTEQYLATPPDEVLAEHEDNFAITRADVLRVRIKLAGSLEDPTTEVLSFKTADETYKLTLTSGSQTRRALREAEIL